MGNRPRCSHQAPLVLPWRTAILAVLLGTLLWRSSSLPRRGEQPIGTQPIGVQPIGIPAETPEGELAGLRQASEEIGSELAHLLPSEGSREAGAANDSAGDEALDAPFSEGVIPAAALYGGAGRVEILPAVYGGDGDR